MENLPQLVPLVILFPAVGAFINLFLGSRLSERGVAIIGSTAAGLSFVVALLLFSYLGASGNAAAVVNPPLLDGWIRLEAANIDFPWQLRVDTLSVTMMLFVTGVGTLIHIYAAGYMHGDPRFARFFVYLNVFLAFMLILVSGNNLLMMFVGWEGVGLSSFLLIGFWFDKAKGEGWKNSNAARKAFIANRVGDFGLIMGMILTFWAFGTLDYYTPGEIANVHLIEELSEEGEHGETLTLETEEVAIVGETIDGEREAVTVETEGETTVEAEGAVPAEIEEPAAAVAAERAEPVEAAVEPFGAREFINNAHISTEDLGVFGQAERYLEAGHVFQIGPLSLSASALIALIAFFFLVGATGKSAQIPLFVWLPDAMAGPTPVSALIHAATMVTAGVYLMVRCNVFYYHADAISFIVTLIGIGTAFVGGFIALGQWDIKRVLAYSTISQLGFMVAAVGVGAYGAAIFHMVTHAFFKALLFLGSGSVIHGVEHGHHAVAHGHGDDHHDEADFDPQDMRNMGGLRRKMPVTYWTYLFGTLALAGIFPFAGFWSKDEILADSWLVGFVDGDLAGFIALGVLLAAAGLTAFYMWRQMELVFYGEPRTEAAEHAHESSPAMTIPLIALAFLSLFGGFINTPEFLGLDRIFGAHELTHFLEFSVANAHTAEFQFLLALLALVIAISAIGAARSIYGRGQAVSMVEGEPKDPLELRPETQQVFALANARLYWDEFYTRFFIKPYQQLAHVLADVIDWEFWHDWFHNRVLVRGFDSIAGFLARPVDVGLIDGTVNFIGAITRRASSHLRHIQTGYVRTYAISLLLGVVLVILFILLPIIQRALAAANGGG